MSTRKHTNWMGTISIEVPTVDAFIDEYLELCRKHGLMFTNRSCDDCSREEAFLDDFRESGAGVYTAIDIEKSPATIVRESIKAFREREEQKRLEARKAAEALAAGDRRRAGLLREAVLLDAKERREREMRENGVQLSDGLYRLVKIEDPASS